jgi:penicillin-binding protein-related factor A (putative recombinase)
MKEMTFQADFGKSFRLLYPNSLYVKIPDAPYNPHIIRRPIQKPFDCFVVNKNIFYAFELKIHNNTHPFLFSRLKPHQEKALLDVSNNGFPALVLINIHVTLTPEKQVELELPNRTLNFVYFTTVEEFIAVRESVVRKSIPFSFFIDKYKESTNIMGKVSYIILSKVKTTLWDVSKILEKYAGNQNDRI